jgi:subfamily B ATP-binding cassette protein MsbA
MGSFRVYMRVLAFMRPYWKRLSGTLALMVVTAVFAGISIGMILPFVNVLFSGGTLGGMEAGKGGGGLFGLTPGSLNTVQERVRQEVLSFYAAGSPLETLGRICLSILILYFIKGLCTYFLSVMSVSIEEKVIRDIRNELYTHLHRLSLAFFHASRTGQIISRITSDVRLVRSSISTGFLAAIRDFLNILVLGGFVVWISWRLALVAVIVIPLITFVVAKIGRRLRRYSTKAQEKMADITTVLQETISGIRVVKAFGMEDFETAKFYGHTNGFFGAYMKRQRAESLAPVMTEFLGAAGGLVVLYYGGMQVLGGNLLSPDWFLIFLAAMLSIIRPAKTLTQASAKIQDGIAAGKRIFTILDAEPDITDAPDAVDIDGIHEGIEFRNVSFKYETSDYVLKDVGFRVNKGQVVAVVGPSGAGKSTLVDLIPRFYDPTEGSVLLDGRDLRKISVRSLRSIMGIVTQETILFNDTIRNNIAYGMEDVPLTKVIDAAKAANAHDFIAGLPEGYDTIIGDRGVRVSGGERQRLAIARAILKDPEILIFDEATSSLDTESEKLVQDAIERLLSHRTNFVIAHRLSTVTNADLIVVIDDGRLVEIGRHSDLLAAGNVYRRLYDLQFKDYSQSVTEN